MAIKKNRFDFDPELKTKYINEVIGFFHDERGEEIGFIAAEKLLDFFIETVGEDIYKKGISDCKKVLREKMEDMQVELELLSPNK